MRELRLPFRKYSLEYREKYEKTTNTFFGDELIVTQPEKNIRCVCLECHYIYDPLKGDPKQGIPPGTAWQDVPDTWHCPECKILKAKKGVFKPLDE
jgi:rubredoxin